MSSRPSLRSGPWMDDSHPALKKLGLADKNYVKSALTPESFDRRMFRIKIAISETTKWWFRDKESEFLILSHFEVDQV